jgi:hypothetical protein
VSLPSGPGGKVYQFVFSHEKRRGFQR